MVVEIRSSRVLIVGINGIDDSIFPCCCRRDGTDHMATKRQFPLSRFCLIFPMRQSESNDLGRVTWNLLFKNSN